MEDKKFKYVYTFYFPTGEVSFPIDVNSKTMTIEKDDNATYGDWAKLDFAKCSACSLDSKDHEYCPLAQALAASVDAFKDRLSTEKIDVRVTTEDRSYYKSADVQHGFSSMLGLLMPVSGCPCFNFFKPMARFHLPFSSLEETIYRVVSSYFLSQHLKKKDKASFDLTPLTKLYERLQTINADFVVRLRSAVNRDGGLNAVVILDTFAQLLPFSFKDGLEDLSYLYNSK